MFSRFGAIRVPVAGHIDVSALIVGSDHPVLKHMNNSAALVARDFLSFKIHLGSFFLIELHPRFFEQFIETLVFPVDDNVWRCLSTWAGKSKSLKTDWFLVLIS